MLLYYITDRTQFPGDEAERQRGLLDKISQAAHAGVDFIQLREKDLSGRELEGLMHAAVSVVRKSSQQNRTRLLINSRTDAAIACEADGVHLRSDDVAASQVREIWSRAGRGRAVVSVSCHSVADVGGAEQSGADLAIFAPVFEKKDASAAGVDALRQACEHGIRVLALGGVTLDNARSCVDAGAAGIAGIRLFQENEIADVVHGLRN